MNARAVPLRVVEPWFSVSTVGHGVTLLTEPWVHEFLRANLWLIEGRERDLLIDTGNGIAPLSSTVDEARSAPGKPLVAVVTHAHSDHMGGLHEFRERFAHRLEAEPLVRAADTACLVRSQLPDDLLAEIADCELALPELLLDAVPHQGFDPASFTIRGTTPSRVLEDGDMIDLGDRVFRVLHLPGHSPGSIGLWEEKTGILFSGDTVYRDGPLLDQMPGSDVGSYCRTMERLCSLQVSIVHGGHDPSFGRARLVEIARRYLAARGCA